MLIIEEKLKLKPHHLMKTKIVRQLTLLCLIFGITVVLPTAATAKGKPRTPAAPKKEVPLDHDKVSAISDTSITVKGKSEQTYTIGQFTEILVNGVRDTAKDIKIGMSVTVGADSAHKATNINAH